MTQRSDLELQISHLQPGRYAFGTIANVSVHVWLCQATGAAALDLKEAASEFVPRHPEGFSAIVWLLAGTELPTAEARGHFIDLLRAHGRALGEVGVVLDGGGFWASAVRAMLTGLKLASAGAMGFRIESGTEQLLAWFPDAHERRTGVALPRAEIARAVEDLVARTRAGG